MILKVESPYQLDAVTVSPLPGGGTDVWLRMNFNTETSRGEFIGGEVIERTVYTADELYFRSNEAISLAYATENFDALWSANGGYNPATVRPPTTEELWREQTNTSIDTLNETTDDIVLMMAELIGGE